MSASEFRPISVMEDNNIPNLESLNLQEAEVALCEAALKTSANFVEAALKLGITRHALKRRIIKHNIEWSPKR